MKNVFLSTLAAAAAIAAITPTLNAKLVTEAAATPAAAAAKSSTPAGFTDDLDAAKAQAAKESKLIFAVFSGSDWCGWCMRLEKEVLSKPEFVEGTKKDFVLVFIDSPNNQGLLSEHAKAENPKLVKQYDINGFPTALILGADGAVLGKTGYRDGGAAAYVKHLAGVVKDAKANQALAKEVAGLAKGSAERVKKLDAMLSKMETEDQAQHKEWVDEVLAADADGKLGYKAHYPYFTIVVPLQERFGKLGEGVQKEYGAAFERMATRDEFRKMNKTQRRELMEKVQQELFKSPVMADYAASLEAFAGEVAKAKATAPESVKEELGDMADGIGKQATELKAKIEEAKQAAAPAPAPAAATPAPAAK